MNDPNSTDSANEAMLESLEVEFMALVKKGDRSAFDFALEFSDAVNHSAQAALMEMMKMANGKSRDVEIALSTRCAMTALSNVIEKEAAPQWAETEYKRRHKMTQDWIEDLTKDAQSAGVQRYS